METKEKVRPSLKWWLLALLALAFWQLLGILDVAWYILVTTAKGGEVSWGKLVGGNLPFWLFVALFTPPVVWVARRVTWEPRRWRRTVSIHFGCLVAFTILHTVTFQLFWVFFQSGESFDAGKFVSNIPKMVASVMDRGILFYLIIVGGTWLVETYARFREREKAAAALELERAHLRASLSEAKLEALRMQLQPHFLFNTLHAISTLILKEETRAANQMLAHLSQFLRLILENAQAPTVPLAVELEFVEAYLRIQKVRFGDQLAVRQEIEEAALVAEVPSLVLQPLVENSIQHGIARNPAGGTIIIRARRAGPEVTLEVEDDGTGLDGMGPDRAEGTEGPGNGIGLRNIRERLAQLYPGAHSFTLGAASGRGARATLRIPFHRAEGGLDASDPDLGR